MIRELQFTPYQLFVATFLYWGTYPLYIGNMYLAFMGAIVPEWRCGDNETSEFGQECPVLSNCSEFDIQFRNSYHSFADDFGLYCDRLYLSSFLGTFQNVGYIVGVFIIGQLSDIFGRKPMAVASTALAIVASTLSTFSPSFWLFMALRIVSVAAGGGLDVVRLSYTMEVVEPHHRLTIGAFFWFAGGTRAIMAGLLFWTGSWTTTMHIINAFSLLPLTAVWFGMTESPQWLGQKNKTTQLQSALRYISQFNHKLRGGGKPGSTQDQSLLQIEQFTSEDKKPSKLYTAKDLFSRKHLALRTLVAAYFVFGGCITSTGIDFMSGKLTGSFVLNNVIIGVLSQVLKPLALVVDTVYSRCDRRLLHQVSLGIVALLIALAAVLTAANQELFSGTVAGLAIAGRVVMEYQWDAISLFCVELFPTVLRSTGMSVAQTLGRSGDVLAPFVAYSAQAWPAAPYFVFAAAGLLGVIISCALVPETKGKPLPDTLDLETAPVT